MANILLTGMTASQNSSKLSVRNRSFATLLARALVKGGHTLTWARPDVSWDQSYFDSYDAVIVGVSPVLSVASNGAYGALKAIESMFYDPRLSLFVDAPVPAQINASLDSIYHGRSDMFKPLFQKRYGHDWAVQNKNVLNSAIELLIGQDWPTTFFPALPWLEQPPLWKNQMPFGFRNAVAVNLDAVDGDVYHAPENFDRYEFWVAESYQSSWTDYVARGLEFNVVPMKLSRGMSDADVMYGQLLHATGSLIGRQKDGHTWWSPRYLQSLYAGTPVVTDWRSSQKIGPSWAVLATNIESMSVQMRYDLAHAQLAEYYKAIPQEALAIDMIEKLIRVS